MSRRSALSATGAGIALTAPARPMQAGPITRRAPILPSRDRSVRLSASMLLEAECRLTAAGPLKPPRGVVLLFGELPTCHLPAAGRPHRIQHAAVVGHQQERAGERVDGLFELFDGG